MTDTEIIAILAIQCIAWASLAGWAISRWVVWRRSARELYEQVKAHRETIGRLEDDNRRLWFDGKLREAEGHRRVFGTAPLDTTGHEHGEPVG